jgi:hypothetical protein
MSKAHIPVKLRREVAEEAHYRCGYCLTATGRATIAALRLNNPETVAARSLWVQAGWHPPHH